MSDIQRWRQKILEQSISDPEAIEQYLSSQPLSGIPFRLEVLKDKDSDLILIQGNLMGLDFLKSALERLVNNKTTGSHIHLEENHGLTKANVSVIVQLIDNNNDNDGPHKIESF